MATQAELIEILYLALGEKVGLLVQAEDPVKAREALYRARIKAGDEALSTLQIRMVDFPDGQIAIVKTARAVRLDELTGPVGPVEEVDLDV